MIDPTEGGGVAQTTDSGPVPPAAVGLSQNRGVMRAAGIIAIGNIVSRVVGMVREIVLADLFGASGLLSAFKLASLVPQTLYNLIVGGEMVTSSLVPVFSDYASQERRADLWAVFSTFLSLTTVVLLGVVVLVELFAPQVAWLSGARHFDDPTLTPIAIQLMRLTTPAVLFLSISSIITAVLFALQRFTLPAFTVATYNGAIVVAALLRPDQIFSLAWGLLVGSLLQVLLQLPALRDARLRLQLDWRHPAIRRILKLYAPIVAGLGVNQAVIWISYNLATRTGDANVTYMGYATTLYQFPLGLVVMGLSIATLPMLSQQANGRLTEFKQTLAQGIRLALVLIIPATVGLFALSTPIVALLFEHGQFTSEDTVITALVLRLYLLGLPFAGVDQMLVYASYARKDTWRPALVGVISMVIYLAVALLLLESLGFLSLMVADAVKHLVHTLMMLWLLKRHVGGLGGHAIWPATLKSLLAAGVTGAAAYGTASFTAVYWPLAGFLGLLFPVLAAGAAGLLVYVAMVWLLDIREAKALRNMLQRKGKQLPE